MTDQPKSTQLSPEEWKQLCLLNGQQLLNFLSGIPPQIESGAPGLTVEHMAQIDAHVARARNFLGAWLRSRPVQPVDQFKPEVPAVSQQSMNGVEPPRQKRKYTKRAKPEIQPRVAQ